MGTTRRTEVGKNLNPKLQRTRDYSMFSFTKGNRPVNLFDLKPQHKKLKESMRRYGFIPAHPIWASVINGKFIIKDGQHRFTFARELGLDLFYVVVDDDISIPEINQAQATWNTKDYAISFANQGIDDYQVALDFAESYGVPIASAAGLLAETIHFSNVSERFKNGTFTIRSKEKARRVLSAYDLIRKFTGVKHMNLLSALWACFHVDYFDESRVINTIRKRPDLMQNVGTRDNFLSVIEDIYNFGRRSKEPIKFDANKAISGRALYPR